MTKPLIIAGIDPGQTGGAAFLSYGTAALLHFEAFTDVYRLADLLDNQRPHMTFVEKTAARPGQGVTSMHSFGIRFGEVIGVLCALKLAHVLVPPATWCKTQHAGCAAGEAKNRSLEAIRRLYPGVDFKEPDYRGKKMHAGIVDAVLIARHGVRTMGDFD